MSGALTKREWWTLAAMATVVVGLHAVGFFILITVVAPHHYHLGTSGAFTVGLGLTAYTLGLRQAFDADPLECAHPRIRAALGSSAAHEAYAGSISRNSRVAVDALAG